MKRHGVRRRIGTGRSASEQTKFVFTPAAAVVEYSICNWGHLTV